jgi:hypothetical protein
MSPAVVRLALVAAAAIAVLTLVGRAGAGPAAGPDFRRFPGDLVLAAPAADLPVALPNVRAERLLASMDAMWRDAFAREGLSYRSPRTDVQDGEGVEGCGDDGGRWAGLYCPASGQILIDMTALAGVRRLGGAEAADVILGYVVAHEMGHHVQFQRGKHPGAGDSPVPWELNAFCLAGVWGRAAGKPLPRADLFYVTDEVHGSAAEQRAWLERGWSRARPADCDGVWDAAG